MESKRVIAFIIDFIITSLVQSILIVFFILIKLASQKINLSTIPFRIITITYCSLLYMIARDCIGSKSIGKRIMKIQVISIDTKLEATLLQRLLRNITWLIGPIEIIYYLVRHQRIGDQIAKTKVMSISEIRDITM